MNRKLRKSISLLLVVIFLMGNSIITESVFAADSSISSSSSSFSMASPQDINVTIILNGNTFTGVKNGTSFLVSGTDYTISGSTVTLKKSYFSYYFGKFTQNCNLTFVFSSGASPVYADSTISPTSISVSKSLSVDTSVYMNLNGNILSSIVNGSYTLVANTDYTVSGSSLTLKSSYLGGLPVGSNTLSFSFNRGSGASLNVNVTDNSTVSPSAITFDIASPL